MNTKEQEYIDCLRDTRNQLTEQIVQHLDEIDLLEKKLDIATKALKEYADPQVWEMDGFCYKDGDVARQALKEMEAVDNVRDINVPSKQ